jgi:hypothetical protein
MKYPKSLAQPSGRILLGERARGGEREVATKDQCRLDVQKTRPMVRDGLG